MFYQGVVSLFKMAHNGSGIAEGRGLEAESFSLAQMPNKSTKY